MDLRTNEAFDREKGSISWGLNGCRFELEFRKKAKFRNAFTLSTISFHCIQLAINA